MMIKQVTLKLKKTAILDYGISRILNEEQAVEVLKRYMNDHCSMDRENVVILCLDIKHNINAIHTVATGTYNNVTINPLEIFKVCILSNSAGFILAHNHPTGDASPSKEDINITNQINEACKVMCIQMLDHIIIGEECLSMKNNELY